MTTTSSKNEANDKVGTEAQTSPAGVQSQTGQLGSKIKYERNYWLTSTSYLYKRILFSGA